ncbi:MAG: four helix bundle protein [Acidobacteria bacterium]|nr:four helix bundle protein [Acidobacteriota bacterium]
MPRWFFASVASLAMLTWARRDFSPILDGTSRACAGGMPGAARFEDLLAWQRAHELHLEIWKATDCLPPGRDRRFTDQIRDASESAGRNVAEGFGRFNPNEFAYFLGIARASLQETKALLKKGVDVGYWSDRDFGRLDSLANRALQSVAKFQRYLRSPQAKRNAEQRYRRAAHPETGRTR